LTGMSERLFKPQDAHKLEDPERLVWLPVAEVLRILGVRVGMDVADIGTGTGYFAIPLARMTGAQGKVYAVDLQPEMLNLLRAKLEGSLAPRNIELVQGEASNTTLSAASVDAVLIANVWHELDDPATALREMVRILRSNGTLAILDWRPDRNPPPGPPIARRIAATDIEQLLQKNLWTTGPPINVGKYSYCVIGHPPRE